MASTLQTPVTTITPAPNRSEFACPACGWTTWYLEKELNSRGYTLCRCRVCRLRFCQPMAAANSEWYGSSWLYKLREADAGENRVERTVPWNFAQALSAIAPGRARKLLDVGCAEGRFLYLARRAGFQVTGLDFNPASLKIAKETFRIPHVYQCSVEELAERFPDASFDVVTLFEVLEHTSDPFATLRSLGKVMKPGAALLLSVPGLDRWPALFHPEVDSPPHHLTLWTEEALKRILERAGLYVQSIDRKPLMFDDAGIHLKWRLQRLLPQRRAPAPMRFSSTNSTAMRSIAKSVLIPVCAMLRLHPRSGGFTLFAHCRRP